MAERYWVGVDQNWHLASNWASVSGGVGGAGIPTSVDDVFFDGNGYVLCWPTSDIECNDMTLLAAMTEMLLIDTASAVINGDFEIQAGYFGPTGGPDHIVEFKGNWLKTGGTFAVGTGTGVDPTCVFSGTGKTYNLNDVGAATFQNVSVTGEVVFSGTRLAVMNVSQKISVTGIMTVNINGLTICAVYLDGTNAGLDVFTGTINGTGRMRYAYRSTHTMPTGGTISIRYWRFVQQGSGNTFTLPARSYTSPCEVEVEYDADDQTFELEAGNHTFYRLTIHGDDVSILTAEFDCESNMAQMWCEGKFDIYKDAFPGATFTLKLGDGTHVFRGSIDFYFSYTSAVTQLIVDAAEGTMILWPKGRTLIPFP